MSPGTAVQPIDWLAITPPLALAVGALAVLVLDAFTARSTRWLATVLSLGAVAVAAGGLVALSGDRRAVFCVADPRVGEACSYAVEPLTLALWAAVLVATLLVVLLSAAGAMDHRVPAAEHHFLLLASACGALTIAAARDLATLVVALEVVSLPAFALVGLKRGDVRSAEAALKFFLVSVVSTAVTLFGVSLIYGVTGSMHLRAVDAALRDGVAPAGVGVVGVVLTLVGLAFKVAAVPFHAWVPDTYVGAPVPVAAYLSTVSKAAGLAGLLVLLTRGFVSYADAWAPVVAVLAAATMTVGNVLALHQRHAVRLLAWSSVAQSGFMLAPLAVVGVGGPAGTDRAVRATLAYLLIYAVINLGAFAVVALLSRHRPGGRIEDYRGLVRREPWAGVGLSFALLCLAGLPPGIIGLFAKVVVFQAVVAGGLGWLAVVMAVNVVIGLAYYLRWIVVVLGPVGEDAARPSVHPLVGATVGATLIAAVTLSAAPSVVLQLL